MAESMRRSWLPIAALLGIGYALVGFTFALPVTHAQAWRLAAWAVSAVGYAAHIAFERVRLRNPPGAAALHVASGVALGSFALAVGGNVHSLSTGQTDQHRQLMLLSLAIWPVITAIPAGLIAFAASFVMKRVVALVLVACGAVTLSCAQPPADLAGGSAAPGADPELTSFIAKIQAVDNHSHPNSIAPDDADADALPLDGLGAFELPARLHPDHPSWLAAYKALYQYPHADLSEAHLKEWRGTVQGIAKSEGEKFPAWVLDQIGTEVLLANRVAMGPGLAPPRVRWVSFVDALMLPLSNASLAAASPDREKLFPLVDKLRRRYLSDLKVAKLPASLDAYLKTVVTATLEAQRQGGAVAVKFEAAYLRALDFSDVPAPAGSAVYAKYAAGGIPPDGDYKALQDYLFRYIAREAGRLGMAVHIHSFEGAGNFFGTAGADPLLLEPVFNDPALRQTQFVIIHGGGVHAAHAGAMLWKPNVYVDTSLMTLAYTPNTVAATLRGWLTQYPEKVLFGSDATAVAPDMGWELTAWVATRNTRTALALALTEMVRNGEVGRGRAEEIATMVLRTNASKLYGLGLK
jgi:hypothetical protein